MPRNHTAFSFLLHSIKPFKFYVGLHLFVVLYNAIDLSLWPYLTKNLVDTLSNAPREQVISQVWPAALLLIIFTILPGLIWRLSDFSWMNLTPLMKRKITVETMDYATQHSTIFFQNNFSGSLAHKVRDLAGCTPQMLAKILYSFLNVILSLAIAFGALFFVHKVFAFALIIWAAIFILMALKAAKIVDPLSVAAADQQTKNMGNLVDVLSNIANVRLFNGRGFETSKIKALQDDYTKLSKRRNIFLIKFYIVHALTFAAYFIFCIVALIKLYAEGLVTLGDFLMLFTINNWIIHLMWMAASEMNVFLEDVGTINQALSIVNQPLQIKDAEPAQNLSVKRGEITFDNVSFSYQKNSEPLFFNKNLTILAGQKVGLVGHSGGGKTTFVNLILRFFDVNSGRILIDQQDISKVTQESLRTAIGMIPQDPSLFHRSLKENISYGISAENFEEIIAAAKKAHAHNFIEALPEKYDSVVGERGVKLSGGQRQRIAIARAFLKNAPILILDEATSQLDSITENLIQDALQNLMQNKTTIVIAHRLSTLAHMDRILVFDLGKIIEDGSHQELLALNGTYKKLWDAQVGGFLIENFDEKND
ncbi:MAG: ABC transporter ATP-binding protein [Rickettsiales bacterium]|nr:ABC transporter ATP-binding protein [Rickettsiales bacterium]